MTTPTSLRDREVQAAMRAATAKSFPSPEDWRDQWIYFLLVDRFANAHAPPRHPDPELRYQGGTFEGVLQQLPYLKRLGVGAIWLSPVLMNPQRFPSYYGGYAIQDFLRIEPRFCRDPAAAEADPALADGEFRALVDAIHAQGMHVVLDIVLNHAGDLFDYEGARSEAPYNPHAEYRIFWRGADNVPRGDWTDIEAVANLPREAGVWPLDLQHNRYFRRRGSVDQSPDPTMGDFGRLKELKTELFDEAEGTFPVRDALIRAYQYLIAKFDLDGFRVDTLMYVRRDFARTFANAVREFALSIGKKNFFTFGEVWQDDDEAKIAEYVGRDTRRDGVDLIGFDAALDFPLRKRIEGVCKGVLAPADLAGHMQHRLDVQRTLLSAHGDVGAYFVTFLENHDLNYRYAASCQTEQVTLALTCLFTLQGIPCLYYGMEQGMATSGRDRESARHCLWRDPGVFSREPQHPICQAVVALSALRRAHPALRYGRQYFRGLSGDGVHFAASPFTPGVLAFSRILNDTEVLVVANPHQQESAPLKVEVDRHLTPPGCELSVLYSNLDHPAAPAAAHMAQGRSAVSLHLRPMEAMVLGQLSAETA